MATLTENSTEHFWLDLINWSNEDTKTPTRRWNLFQTWLLHQCDFQLTTLGEKSNVVTNEVSELRDEYPYISDDENTEIQEYIDKYGELIKQLDFLHDLPINIAFDRSLDNIDFSNAEFLAPVDFNKTIFQGKTKFSRAKFHFNVGYAKAKFECPAEFKHVEFKEDAVFDGTLFEHNAYFNDAVFRKEAHFGNPSSDTSLEPRHGAQFLQDAEFKGAIFEKEVIFNKVHFRCGANFNNTTFKEFVSFDYARFGDALETKDFLTAGESTTFKYAKFERGANFKHVEFKERDYYVINFKNTLFQGLVTFSNAVLEEVSFKGAKFRHVDKENHSYFLFNEVRTKGIVDFSDVFFEGTTKFDDLQNKAQLDFTNAIFKRYPPRTFGTSLHANSSFLKVEWPEIKYVNWPEIKHVSWPIVKKKTAENHFKTYERLRIQVQSLGMIESRNIIVRKELECRAIAAEGTDKLLRNAYGLISNHGTSVGRPLYCLLITFFCILTAWDAVYFPYSSDLVGSSTFWDIFGFNFSKVIPFTSMGNYQTDSFKTLIQEAPIFLIFLSSILSIISPILLFLAGLGVRSKFRMSL